MSAAAEQRSGFDKLAGAYRWMEYVSFGPLLQRCRVEWLPRAAGARTALVLGDGDGRFCAALLRAVPGVRVTAVDESARMLRALRMRVTAEGNADRLRTVHGDALRCVPRQAADLVCTHFFLDCLPTAAVDALVGAVLERTGCRQWMVSEFAVPGGVARLPAAVLVRGMYVAFGLLTGLRTRTLPEHGAVFRRHGLMLAATRTRLGGLLRSELWEVRDGVDAGGLSASKE